MLFPLNFHLNLTTKKADFWAKHWSDRKCFNFRVANILKLCFFRPPLHRSQQWPLLQHGISSSDPWKRSKQLRFRLSGGHLGSYTTKQFGHKCCHGGYDSQKPHVRIWCRRIELNILLQLLQRETGNCQTIKLATLLACRVITALARRLNSLNWLNWLTSLQLRVQTWTLLQPNGQPHAWIALYQNQQSAQTRYDCWYFEYGNGTKVPFSGYDDLWGPNHPQGRPTEKWAGMWNYGDFGDWYAGSVAFPVLCEYEEHTGEYKEDSFYRSVFFPNFTRLLVNFDHVLSTVAFAASANQEQSEPVAPESFTCPCIPGFTGDLCDIGKRTLTERSFCRLRSCQSCMYECLSICNCLARTGSVSRGRLWLWSLSQRRDLSQSTGRLRLSVSIWLDRHNLRPV